MRNKLLDILSKIKARCPISLNELAFLTMNEDKPVSKVVLTKNDGSCMARIYFDENPANAYSCEVLTDD